MNTSPCSCPAYAFPHRSGGGHCGANESDYYCGHCGGPCQPEVTDEGVGRTEYWGSVSTHHDYQVVSSCCGEEVRRYETGEEVTLRQLNAQQYFDDDARW